MSETIISTDAEILELISCPKIITQRPRAPREQRKKIEQRLTLKESDGERTFSVFISFLIFRPSDFSVGLLYQGYNLLRCNGFHGTTIRGFYSAKHHEHAHIHRLTVDDIKNGRMDAPSFEETVDEEYDDLDTARLYFFQRCGIINYGEHFDSYVQTKLDL